jgi:hypothetical protein
LFVPNNWLLCALHAEHDLDEDITEEQALLHPLWKAAMQSEYNSLMENGTWTLEVLPPGRKSLHARWVLRLKPDLHPTHTRLKAGLIVKGYEQKFGIDYSETYAPVVRWSSLWLIIAIAAVFGWSIVHMDIVTAFLNGKLQETIYMHQP